MPSMKQSMRGLVIWLVLSGISSWSYGATLATELFSSGKAGWTNEGPWTIHATNQYLRGTFPAQGIPLPDAASWLADNASSSGAFAGNYHAIDAGLIGFAFYAEHVLPSELQIRLSNGEHSFFHSVVGGLISTGIWHRFDISLEGASAGGWLGGDDAAFEALLTNVVQVTIQVFRSGATLQRYRLDDVFLGKRPSVDAFTVDNNDIMAEWVDVRSGRVYRVQSASHSGSSWTNTSTTMLATGLVLRTVLPENSDSSIMFRLIQENTP